MNRGKIAGHLEAFGVWLLFNIFGLLPLDIASAIGGWLGRTIGYRLPVTRRARRNLARFMPHLSTAEQERILLGMWDNLGRVAAEYPHLSEFGFGPGERVTVERLEYLEQLRDDGKPGLFFSGHMGNWELNGFCAVANGVPLHLIYRGANNPRVDWIYRKGRSNAGVHLIPKGSRGARQALELLRKGEHIGMLMDQKMNDGVPVPFFGTDAMTAPALASFALKYRCPVVPAHIVRLSGAHFHMIFEPPLDLPATGNHQADSLEVLRQVNEKMEGWVREHPEQWLWLHKRWPE